MVLGEKMKGKLFPRLKRELGHHVRGQLLQHPGTGTGTGPTQGDVHRPGVGKPTLARVRCLKWKGVSRPPNPCPRAISTDGRGGLNKPFSVSVVCFFF